MLFLLLLLLLLSLLSLLPFLLFLLMPQLLLLLSVPLAVAMLPASNPECSSAGSVCSGDSRVASM